MASLVVTFVGLPGTGKSTLSARAAQLLRQRGIPCRVCEEAPFRKIWNKAAWVAREVIGNPRRAARSVRGILATRQRSVLDLVKMVVNWFCLSFLIRRAARAGGVCLFDEGLYQALWSIGLGARSEGWLSSLPVLDPVPPAPSLTVVVRSSLETVERRLAARPLCASRLEQWLPQDLGILGKAGRLMDVVQELAGRRCRLEEGMRILMIDNDRKDALQANALRITDYVQQLLTDSKGAPPAAGDGADERAACTLVGGAAR